MSIEITITRKMLQRSDLTWYFHRTSNISINIYELIYGFWAFKYKIINVFFLVYFKLVVVLWIFLNDCVP